jgi:sugar phosphate isomerase/epimerase
VPDFSLDSLTLTDTSPADLIRSAHIAGFDLVSLWTQAPSLYPKQLLTPDMERACAALLRDTGIGVHSLETFELSAPEAARAARPAIELGARLGAKAVLAINFLNPQRGQTVDALGALAEEARQCGLAVLMEPVAMGQTRTLVQARDLIRDAGVDAGVLFDAYHFVRAGGTRQDIAAIDPALIRYVQINDGPASMPESDWIAESIGERLFPGSGEFPLVELLRMLPRDIPWAIETPSLRRARGGVSPEAQAKDAMASLRALLAQLDAG